jgi:UDP-2,4-diacetamido-2,4,6-trideoxy-beta-L-altropyranose hydrolase
MNDDRFNLGTQTQESFFSLRKVMEEDCQLLWEWANEPSVRAVSFSSEPISWSQHLEWFDRKLQDLNCYFFIALNRDNIPIGQVRFDREAGDRAVISIALAPEKRGFGYGSIVLNMAVEEIFSKTPIQTIFAFIKPSNSPSIRLFEKAEFQRMGQITIKGYVALQYRRSNSVKSEFI